MKASALVILVQFISNPGGSDAVTVATFRDRVSCEIARNEFIERLEFGYVRGMSFACLSGVVTRSWPAPGPGQ